ncbi:hypothetical protein ABE049_26180 [Priestia megaterium]
MEFLKTLVLSTDVWGSIIGGLVGGLFTYLSLILTFRNQNKSESPQKLVHLTTMIESLRSIKELLDMYVEELNHDEDPIYILEGFNLKEIMDSMLLAAARIDKKTYHIVRTKRTVNLMLGYLEAFDPISGTHSTRSQKAYPLSMYLASFIDELEKRHAYYEKRL